MTLLFFFSYFRRIWLKFTVLAIFLPLFFSASGQTVFVSGNINYNTVWQADTVLVTGNVTVASGAVLSIEPGVIVKFNGFYGITVLGSIRANGLPGDSIYFTVADTSGYHNQYSNTGGWCGIYLTGNGSPADSSVFSYCKFMYCKNNIIYSYPCKTIRVVNCRFQQNQYGLRFVGSGVPVIRNNVFSDLASSAVSFCDNCSPEITYNTMTHVACGILGINSGGIISHNIISYSSLYCAIVIDGGAGYAISKNHISHNPLGGISIYGSDSSLVEENIIEYNGRGIYIESPNSTVIRNNIAYNTSPGGGSGMFVRGQNIKIAHNRICNNQATGYGCGYSNGGGGIMCVNTSVNIINNVICNNESESIGAGICVLDSVSGLIVNNTISNNLCNQGDGGGVYINSVFPVSFNSNILCGNRAVDGDQLRCFGPQGSLDFNYCLIGDTTDASPDFTAVFNGLLLADAEFRGPTPGAGVSHNGLLADWSLLPISPCINTGRPDTIGMHLYATDISGNNRISGRRIDVGAFENSQVITDFPDIEERTKPGLLLFPNPARDFVNIVFDCHQYAALNVTVADISGKILLCEELSPVDGRLVNTIDLSGLSAGIYSLWLGDGEKTVAAERLIIE